jgi:hypothetical protein
MKPDLPATIGCIDNTIRVAAGHYVDVKHPTAESIDIISIAADLSKVCRYGGQSPRFYSVAEHCVLATMLAIGDGVGAEGIRAIFLHDSPEAYIGDVVKPLKVLLPDYAAIEERMEAAVGARFGVDFAKMHAVIKDYDYIMLKAVSGFGEVGQVALLLLNKVKQPIAIPESYRGSLRVAYVNNR